MLKIDNIKKDYEDLTIGPLNFSIKNEETIAIIGKSGSGKTSLINLITRIIEADEGEISYNEKLLNKTDYTYINQKGTLFNHLTILQNLRLTYYGDEIEIKNIFKKLNLQYSFINKYPFELSGGEQQRVDLARALLQKSKIIILDEALSALDINTKDQIYELLKKLRNENKLIIIIITHDINEALTLGDKILILDNGEKIFLGNQQELLRLKSSDTNGLLSNKRIELLRKEFGHE